jgi:hypothetical protein
MITKVIARLNGGMGNQMFQYAYASALAREQGAQLWIDRAHFDLPQTPERYRLDEFAIDLPFVAPSRSLLHRALLSPKLPRSVKAALSFVSSTQIVGEAVPLKPHKNSVLLFGYFQNPAIFAAQASALRDAFSVPLVGKRAREVRHKMEQSSSVAVHVRRGDYAAHAQFREQLGVLSPDYYRAAIASIEAQLTAPKFFFFSDDPAWVEMNLLPLTQSGELVALGEEAQDITEMALMSACDHFIVANSTFSWWPAFLGEAKDKIVLCPSPWFRGVPEAGADLIIPDWQTLEPDWED